MFIPIVAIALVIESLSAQPSQPPLLVIESVKPESSETCTVQLKNVHDRNAIAWSVSMAEGESTGTDLLLVPEQVMAPGASRSFLAGCPNPPSAIAVAIVQYDDGSVAGDMRQFERSSQVSRRRKASGLRELVRLLWTTPPPDMRMDGVEAVRRVILASSGPGVDLMVKTQGTETLRRTLRTLPGGTGDYNTVRAALIMGLEENIAMLDRFTQ